MSLDAIKGDYAEGALSKKSQESKVELDKLEEEMDTFINILTSTLPASKYR